MVYRVYVEKKEALANEARALLEDLRAFLGIQSLTGLRLFNRYDLEGISRELFDYAVQTVLSEPQLDTVTSEVPQGDTVFAVEDPGYPKIRQVYDACGAVCAPIPLDGQGVELSALERSGAKALHISPNHQYPTGLVTPIVRRQALLRWAEDTGSTIIEDDYDSELRLGGKPFPTLQSIDVSDKVIYMNTFTKTLASTVRISYMVLPQTLAEKFYRELSFYSCTVSNFEQYTLAEFIENGSFEKHINRLRNYYQNKRDLILQALEKKPLGDYVTIEEEEAGVHFLMHLCTDQKEEKIVTQAKSRGVKLKPLSGYYADTAEAAKQENTYVMNYSSIDPAAMERAAGVLLHILQIPGR